MSPLSGMRPLSRTPPRLGLETKCLTRPRSSTAPDERRSRVTRRARRPTSHGAPRPATPGLIRRSRWPRSPDSFGSVLPRDGTGVSAPISMPWLIDWHRRLSRPSRGQKRRPKPASCRSSAATTRPRGSKRRSPSRLPRCPPISRIGRRSVASSIWRMPRGFGATTPQLANHWHVPCASPSEAST